MRELIDLLPLVKVEQGAILSAFGDITIGYRAVLPEIFTLSDRDYDAYHQAWVKAIAARLFAAGNADASMIAHMSFAAHAGHACGMNFKAGEHLHEHPEFGWEQGALRDMDAYPWTNFSITK